VAAGLGDGDGDSTLGLGLTIGVEDGVRDGVGDGDATPGEGDAELAGVGLAAGPPQAATKTRANNAEIE